MFEHCTQPKPQGVHGSNPSQPRQPDPESGSVSGSLETGSQPQTQHQSRLSPSQPPTVLPSDRAKPTSYWASLLVEARPSFTLAGRSGRSPTAQLLQDGGALQQLWLWNFLQELHDATKPSGLRWLGGQKKAGSINISCGIVPYGYFSHTLFFLFGLT